MWFLYALVQMFNCTVHFLIGKYKVQLIIDFPHFLRTILLSSFCLVKLEEIREVVSEETHWKSSAFCQILLITAFQTLKVIVHIQDFLRFSGELLKFSFIIRLQLFYLTGHTARNMGIALLIKLPWRIFENWNRLPHYVSGIPNYFIDEAYNPCGVYCRTLRPGGGLNLLKGGIYQKKKGKWKYFVKKKNFLWNF